MKNYRKTGFTLIELLIVVVIIGLLATIAIASYGSIQSKARDAQRLKDLDNVKYALINYHQEHGEYPSVGGIAGSCYFGSGGSCLSELTASGMLNSLPKNPRGSNPADYFYKNNSGNVILGVALEDNNNGKSDVSNDISSESFCTGKYCITIK